MKSLTRHGITHHLNLTEPQVEQYSSIFLSDTLIRRRGNVHAHKYIRIAYEHDSLNMTSNGTDIYL